MTFRSEHPGHKITVKDGWGEPSTVSCSCGRFKKSCRTRAQAETLAGQHYAQTRGVVPGGFQATCKISEPVPYDSVPEGVRPLVDADVTTPGRIKSRWHRKLGNVVDLPCDFTTDDRAAFEAHMLEVHGRKSARRAVWSTPSSELPFTTTPRWKPPKLSDEGTPWEDKKGLTDTCPACGAVYEIGVEHQAECDARRDVA